MSDQIGKKSVSDKLETLAAIVIWQEIESAASNYKAEFPGQELSGDWSRGVYDDLLPDLRQVVTWEEFHQMMAGLLEESVGTQ